MNTQHMYDLSTPTQPDHLADITAGMRALMKRGQHALTQAELAEMPNFGRPNADLVAAYSDAIIVLAEPTAPVRPERLKGPRLDPYGDRFLWGPITETHQIGPYTIVEYLDDRSGAIHSEEWAQHGRTLYHVYVEGRSAHISALSLDAALAGAIAFRRDGSDSRAGDYFMRMVGGGD